MSGRLLICTDLDRTLLPNGPAPESPTARPRFRRLVRDERITLVYVTGRDEQLVKRAIDEYDLPDPDHLIADVGATIADIRNGRWLRRADWDREIAVHWCGRDGDQLHALLADVPELRRQAPDRQGRFKLSYEIDLPAAADRRAALTAGLIDKAQRRLHEGGIEANLIWSVDETTDLGLLDVLPAAANKRLAIDWLGRSLGFRADEIVFAGDSGNDLEVLASPVRAILVANAAEDVRRQAVAAAELGGWRDALYLAVGGWSGMNGNYAAGILEGLTHYHPELKELLEADA